MVLKRKARALALVAALVAAGCAKSDPEPEISLGPRTANFRVLYRVLHTETPGTREVSWELLTVNRPFHASDFTYKQRPDVENPGAPDSGTVTDVDHLYSHDGTALRAVAGRPPGIGTGDQALLEVATDAAARGLARVGGTRRILGRTCTTVQFLEPPTGPLAPFDDADNHDDVCLTRGGVVLRDVWTRKGRVIVAREAVLYDEVEHERFDTTNAEQVTGGLALPRAQPIEAGVAPPPAPEGYDLAAAVDFALPRPDAPTLLSYASKVWAFARGAHVVTVELGAGQVVPWDVKKDRPMRLRSRTAGSTVRSDGNEIHWTNAEHWIRVRGSTSFRTLKSYAAAVSDWDSSAASSSRR